MALKIANKIYLSWDDVSQLVDTLCEKIITEQPNIDSVFGLKRGGLIPAVMVSHKLGLPWSDVMYPNTLVVDDICDSGSSIMEMLFMVNSRIPECVKVVTLLKRKGGVDLTNFHGFEIDDEWVVGYGLDDNGLKRELQDIYKVN
jgi:hypoxanthine phosphoribosyltransferase